MNMVNNTLGYDLSDTIDMVTDYWEADVLIRRMFENKTTFTELLNNWGPMFWISTPDNGRWLAQQREGRKWFIFKGGWTRRWGIDEHQLLSYMGIDMFGVPLDTIIDNFVKILIKESQYKMLTEQVTWYDPRTWFGDDKKLSCSPDNIDANDWKELYGELVKYKLIKPGTELLIVWGDNQVLYYTQDGNSLTKSFKVSTGVNGFNNQPDNKQTPTGLMQIKGKVRAKQYEVLVSKTPTGKILGPNVDSTRVDNAGNKHIAEVLTGLLELDGLESCNKNTFSRNIYFHGTNKEKFLGTRRSNGCIRVSNSNVQWMIGNIPEGTKVYIKL